MNLSVHNDIPYAFETWGKASFLQKAIVISWVFVEILSCDVLYSADFINVD